LQNTIQPLTDGSAVVVTTSKILTGRDESFDGVGVLPDMELPIEGDNSERLFSINIDEDTQSRRALELLASMTGGVANEEEQGVVAAAPNMATDDSEEDNAGDFPVAEQRVAQTRVAESREP
jgi:C-terminal processing protease CtpA/Prc